MNYRLICRHLGLIAALFTSSMVTMIPFILFYAGSTRFNEALIILPLIESMLAGAALSLILFLPGRRAQGRMYRREALAVVGLSWLMIAGIGALPLWLGGLVPTYVDGYFEVMSGLTTTGSTILTEIGDHQSRSLHFWRAFMHFVGGLGIIVFFVAVLPILGVGGKTLFLQEVPGPIPEGLTPRIKDTAVSLCKIYVGLNILHFLVLKAHGLSYYDALLHSMSTMATGGFSNQPYSIASYQNGAVEWSIMLFMFLAGTNFNLHLKAAAGDLMCYFRDTEFRVYLGLIVLFGGLMGLLNMMSREPEVSPYGSIPFFRDGLFTSITIITTTGYGTIDFVQWSNLHQILLVMMMFAGGMAGSTAGGIKVVRLVMLMKMAAHELRTNVSPRRVNVVKIDGKPLDNNTQRGVLIFVFIYVQVFICGVLALGLLDSDKDIVTIVTASASALNNIGPGLSNIGPVGNFAGFTQGGKVVLSLLMVMGRLELYAILILFSPGFWRGR